MANFDNKNQLDESNKLNNIPYNESNQNLKQDVISDDEIRKQFKFDELKIYFGEPYKINEDITITIPTIGDILEFGESRLYEMLTPFTANPTQYRVMLWDNGIDWNDVSDFEFFIMFCQKLQKTETKLLFGDFDFSEYAPCTIQRDEFSEPELILVNQEQTKMIDKKLYLHISEYIRTIFDMHPKTEKAKGKTAKEWTIDIDRNKILEQSLKGTKSSSMLLPLVSSLLNHPGFKYNRQQLKECTITEFMDSVQRLQIMQSAFSLMTGMYSGMVDLKGREKDLNWLRDLHE